MKGTAGPARAVVVIAFGLLPGAIGELLRREHAEHSPTGGVDGVGLPAGWPSTNALDDSRSRRLQTITSSPGDDDALGNDDALDINGTPAERAANALTERIAWAETEFLASEGTFHENLGDFSSAATFHKSLPHDDLGQVFSFDFDDLLECVASGDFDTCQLVPAGNDEGFLVNPLGGLANDMAGPAGHALTIPSAPALNSEDLAAQIAEVYWMALTRDVPFSQYGEDAATVEAADNLAAMPGFADLNFVAVGPDGRADPLTQLFRSSAVGVETGPHVSQLLVNNFTIDSITVEARQNTFAPGEDYMADYDEWLSIQNGEFPVEPEVLDPVPRFIRNGRDLSTMAATDTINTEAYRSALILMGEDAISRFGFNGPYVETGRQVGFVNYGISHMMRLVGTGELSMRSSWYQKWNVHLFARPEAIGGTIHNVLNGDLNVEFADSIINNDLLFSRVAARNSEITGLETTRPSTFLLSQSVREGSPTHPSYPSGHAVQNGAFSTVLKALVGLERGLECFDDPVFPADDGLTLLPYDGCLTFEGEINKMAANVALGRNWMGVHWRMDAQEGLLLGETVAVRILQQEVAAFPENEPYEFRLMSGQIIRLEPDGSFFVDNLRCSGEAFEGADLC